MECLLYFLKNEHLSHPKYLQQAAADKMSAVHCPDRQTLLDYLHGKETQLPKNIDMTVRLEMPTYIIITESHELKNNMDNLVKPEIKNEKIEKYEIEFEKYLVKGIPIYKCLICDEYFNDIQLLANHHNAIHINVQNLIIHQITGRYRCEKCSGHFPKTLRHCCKSEKKGFGNPYENPAPFTVTVSKTLANAWNFKIIQDSKDDKIGIRYGCEQCDFVNKNIHFHQYREKQAHLSKVHFKGKLKEILPNRKPFECPETDCNFVADEYQVLKRHKHVVDLFLKWINEAIATREETLKKEMEKDEESNINVEIFSLPSDQPAVLVDKKNVITIILESVPNGDETTEVFNETLEESGNQSESIVENQIEAMPNTAQNSQNGNISQSSQKIASELDPM